MIGKFYIYDVMMFELAIVFLEWWITVASLEYLSLLRHDTLLTEIKGIPRSVQSTGTAICRTVKQVVWLVGQPPHPPTLTSQLSHNSSGNGNMWAAFCIVPVARLHSITAIKRGLPPSMVSENQKNKKKIINTQRRTVQKSVQMPHTSCNRKRRQPTK